MNIFWHGQTCFTLNFQQGKQVVSALFNPIDANSGLKPVRKEPDILLLSKSNGKKDKSFLIDGPGEYEIKDVIINGFYSFKDGKIDQNTVYLLEEEGLKICHLGLLKQKELEKEQLDKLSDVDILLLPIGGKESIEAKEAAEIVSEIEPQVTIPMYYQIPKLKEKLNKLEDFLKVLGVKSLEPLKKFSVKKKDLLNQDPKIVVLEP